MFKWLKQQFTRSNEANETPVENETKEEIQEKMSESTEGSDVVHPLECKREGLDEVDSLHSSVENTIIPNITVVLVHSRERKLCAPLDSKQPPKRKSNTRSSRAYKKRLTEKFKTIWNKSFQDRFEVTPRDSNYRQYHGEPGHFLFDHLSERQHSEFWLDALNAHRTIIVQYVLEHATSTEDACCIWIDEGNFTSGTELRVRPWFAKDRRTLNVWIEFAAGNWIQGYRQLVFPVVNSTVNLDSIVAKAAIELASIYQTESRCRNFNDPYESVFFAREVKGIMERFTSDDPLSFIDWIIQDALWMSVLLNTPRDEMYKIRLPNDEFGNDRYLYVTQKHNEVDFEVRWDEFGSNFKLRFIVERENDETDESYLERLATTFLYMFQRIYNRRHSWILRTSISELQVMPDLLLRKLSLKELSAKECVEFLQLVLGNVEERVVYEEEAIDLLHDSG